MNDDFKELFKREVARYEYLYAKANTKSKKREIAYDLIFFEDMYNNFMDEEVEFSWSNDIDLIDVRIDVANSLVKNVLSEQHLLKEIFEKNFNVFLEEDFSLYTDYSKNYHKLSEELMQKNIGMFLRNIDKSLVDRFKDKLINGELFINNTINGFSGLTFPLEAVDKNIIMYISRGNGTIEDARILAHELGHDFEFENAKKSGITSVWNKISKTIYVEVCSCFFEYAFINYMIDNRIYLEDALMLRRRYLNGTLYYLSYALTLLSVDKLKIDFSFDALLENRDVVDYANELLIKMNSYDKKYVIGDKLNFRVSFVYALGKLMSIYVYEMYKNNPNDFLANFRKVLIDYKDNNFESFEKIGITKDMMTNGDILRRVLRNV